MIKVQDIWGSTDTGLIVPIGRISDATAGSRSDYLAIRTKAKEIEGLFADAGVRLPENSDLGQMLQNGKELWTNWFLDNKEKLTSEVFFLAMHLDRIADAVLPLATVAKKADYLKALVSGGLNFFQRAPSKAKSILWELEVWSRLLRRRADARLEEPPDVTVNYENFRIGIACKKLYSEGHVQNVLSEAVGQIEGEFDLGIVAVNLDDLLPPEVVLKKDSSDAVAERLRLENSKFLHKHERHFRRYLAKGRLISAFVSTSIITDVPTEKPQFRNTYQWTVWTIPGLDNRRREAVERFYASVMAYPASAGHGR